jgi:hypothetical protein
MLEPFQKTRGIDNALPLIAGAVYSAALDLTLGRTEGRAPDVKTMPS